MSNEAFIGVNSAYSQLIMFKNTQFEVGYSDRTELGRGLKLRLALIRRVLIKIKMATLVVVVSNVTRDF